MIEHGCEHQTIQLQDLASNKPDCTCKLKLVSKATHMDYEAAETQMQLASMHFQVSFWQLHGSRCPLIVNW